MVKKIDTTIPEGLASTEVTQEELAAQIKELAAYHENRRMVEQAEQNNRANMLLDKLDETKNDDRPQSRNRESMEFEGREFARREMLERKFYQCNALGNLHVDPASVPSDETWFWATNHMKGQDNIQELNKLLFKEWDFVSPQEAPDLCRVNKYSQENGYTQSNFVTNGASILMKRKKYITAIEMEILLKRQHEVEAGVTQSTNEMSDEKIPVTHRATSRIIENQTFKSASPYGPY